MTGTTASETVVDTSAWVELLIGSKAGRSVRSMMPELSHVIVPTIVQLELAKWVARELDEDAANKVLAMCQTCIIVPLTTSIAIAAADWHRTHKLATADAIIYATAREMGASLLTCDAHFEGLDHVTLVRKAGEG